MADLSPPNGNLIAVIAAKSLCRRQPGSRYAIQKSIMPFQMTFYAAEGPVSSDNAILYDKQDADMIKCHLSRLMGERKVRVADVALATGLHRNMLTLLYRETAQRVELDAIDKLCRYFGVPVGALFEFIDAIKVVDEH